MSETCQKENGCPIINALNLVGGKWKLPILWQLFNSDLRYNELKRILNGITNIMLTRCLRDLEESGLVTRIQYSETPPHVEYSLTPYSRKLANALTDIKEWGEQTPSIPNNKTKD